MNFIMQLKLESYEHKEELLAWMQEHIGDLNPVIREDLILTAFSRMVTKQILTKEELIQTYRFLKSENGLLYHLSTEDDTGVYTRSYSALWLLQILTDEAAKHLLTHAQFHDLVTAVSDYMLNETDRRGYTQYGWAHAIAHGADLIGAIVTHPLFSHQHAELMIESIISNVTNPYPYRDSEIMRLALAAKTMLFAAPFAREELLHEIHYKIPLYYDIDKKDVSAASSRVKENTRNFIQQLYFLLDGNDSLQKEIYTHALKLR